MARWGEDDRRGGPAPSGGPQASLGAQGERGGRRRSGRAVAAYLLAAVGLLVVGAALGVQGSRWWGGDEPSEAELLRDELARVRTALSVVDDRNWKYYRENRALEQELSRLRGEDAGTATSTTDSAVPPGTYVDGVYLVGEDLPPGTYDGVVLDRVGYWARLRNTAGMIDGIIANAVVRGPFVLTVYESDTAVELQGVRLTAR